MNSTHRILIIIPKSTMTIIGVFHNERCIFKDTITHHEKEHHLNKEIGIRQHLILESLSNAGINLSKLDAISAIGGLLRSIEGGTYIVNDAMINDLNNSYNGKHASNIGGILAKQIAEDLNISAYIIDPPVVDELEDIARYSGYPQIERKSIFHALNQKAVARQVATKLNKTYSTVNFIIAHIGNGISIGAHKHAKVIDVNNGLHGDGPFSFERAGTIPSEDLIQLCYSNQFSKDHLIKQITFESGLRGYLNITDFEDLHHRLENRDTETCEVLHAMAYQISKEIGAMATVLQGDIDAIILTGNFAGVPILTDYIISQVNWISDVMIYPGERDLQALNAGTLRVLRKEEEPMMYLQIEKEGEQND